MCDATVKDTAPCTAGSADCNKSCGIAGSGAVKPCTCDVTIGQWDCGVGTCTYAAGFDNTCYKVPLSLVPICPSGTTNNVSACVPTTPCTNSICSGYFDGTVPKNGMCACTGLKAADGGPPVAVYLCSSFVEWPPQ